MKMKLKYRHATTTKSYMPMKTQQSSKTNKK